MMCICAQDITERLPFGSLWAALVIVEHTALLGKLSQESHGWRFDMWAVQSVHLSFGLCLMNRDG